MDAPGWRPPGLHEALQREPTRYIVVRGDTLGRIAKLHGVTVEDLQAWNDLTGDLIEIGQVIEIHGIEVDVIAPTEVRSSKKQTRSSKPSSGGTSKPTAAATESWTLPPKKKCLPPPSGDGPDGSIRASQGLSPDQIKRSFQAFAPKTASCLPKGWKGSATIMMDLRIGCDGRVRDVDVVSGGGLDSSVLGCVSDRMKYASFPAHDLPDGDEVRLPLRLFGS